MTYESMMAAPDRLRVRPNAPIQIVTRQPFHKRLAAYPRDILTYARTRAQIFQAYPIGKNQSISQNIIINTRHPEGTISRTDLEKKYKNVLVEQRDLARTAKRKDNGAMVEIGVGEPGNRTNSPLRLSQKELELKIQLGQVVKMRTSFLDDVGRIAMTNHLDHTYAGLAKLPDAKITTTSAPGPHTYFTQTVFDAKQGSKAPVYLLSRTGHGLDPQIALGRRYSAVRAYGLGDDDVRGFFDETGSRIAGTYEERAFVRANHGIPKQIDRIIAAGNTDGHGGFTKAPTVVVNEFDQIADHVDFRTHTNTLASFGEVPVENVLRDKQVWKKGQLNRFRFYHGPPIDSALARDLSTVQRTAAFEYHFPRSAKVATALSKLRALKPLVPVAGAALLALGTYGIASEIKNAYDREGRFGWNSLRATVDGFSNLVISDPTGTLQGMVKSETGRGIAALKDHFDAPVRTKRVMYA